MHINYKKQLFYLVLITSLIKIIVSGLVELGNDEVYYYTYALQPDYNHFDHPPMVGLLIRLTTLNLHWANDITMRFGAVLGCAISSFFIFNTGKNIGTEKTGWYAALLYNGSVYSSIIAGLFILPDSPQMPLWTGALYVMSLIICKQEDKKLSLWLWLGLLVGLACLCKVHGMYLWAGFGLFMLIKRSKWLLNWRLYVGVAITLVCLLPIAYWNIQNGFITYKFHSERVTNTSLQWDMLLQEVIGELAYQNPVIFILVIVAAVYFIRNKNLFNATVNTWLLCMGLPMILLFWVIALFNPTLPHWSGPAYIPLYFIAAHYLEIKAEKTYPLFIKIAGGLVITVIIAAVGLVRFAPFNIGSQDKESYGEYCPTLDISGWKDFGHAFTALAQKDDASKTMKPNSPIIAGKWFPAGHIEFYVSRPSGLRVLAVGDLVDVHKFAWLNKERKPLQLGDDAYCIVPSNVPFNVTEAYSNYFTTIEKPTIIHQIRSGKTVRYFYVYRLKNCKLVPNAILAEPIK